jgi:hypothetical protein
MTVIIYGQNPLAFFAAHFTGGLRESDDGFKF